MPVIRSTSIDLQKTNVRNKDSKPAANSPVIEAVIEEDPEATGKPPVVEESFRKI